MWLNFSVYFQFGPILKHCSSNSTLSFYLGLKVISHFLSVICLFFKSVVILRLLESNVNKFGIQSSNSQISKSMSKQNTMAAWTHFHFGTMEVKKWCMAKNFNWCFHAILTFLNIHLKYRTHAITSCSLNFLILLFSDGILANITICT